MSDPQAAREKLEASLERMPDSAPESAKTLLLLARAENELGEYGRAIEALDRVDQGFCPKEIVDLIELERALSLAFSGNPEALAALKGFLARHPRSDRRNEARLLLARTALEAGDKAEARRSAVTVLGSNPGHVQRSNALLLKARASKASVRRRTMKEIFVEFPDTPAAAFTGLKETDLSRGELKRRASAFFRSMDYEGYQRILQSLWDAGPRDPVLARRLAKSHLVYVRDDAQRAIELMDVAEDGGAIGHAEAVFQRARAFARLEEYDRASELYHEYLSIAPRGRKRIKALYYLGWLPYDHGRYQEALPEFDRFLKKVGRHRSRSLILWAKGWSLYQLERYTDALQVFEKMRSSGHFLIAGKAMYWGGMAHMELGHEESATRWMEAAVRRYPMTWYAVLAAGRLQQWNGKMLPEWISGPAAVPRDPEPFWPFERLPGSLARGLRRVKDLSDVGETSRARSAYRRIARRVERRFKGADRARFLLTVYDAIEDYHALHSKARREFGGRMGGVPDRDSALFWMARYPRAHRDMALVAAQRFNIPEYWIYAIMRQESRYHPRRISHTAALGIMQMIPKTARVVSKALGVDFEVESFFGPGLNLLFGSYYLGALLDDFRRQIVFASAAYNAGAPPIKRFMAQHKGSRFDEMVEFISYNEARNYCRMVAGHLVVYALLHLDPGQRKLLYEMLFPGEVDYRLGAKVDY